MGFVLVSCMTAQYGALLSNPEISNERVSEGVGRELPLPLMPESAGRLGNIKLGGPPHLLINSSQAWCNSQSVRLNLGGPSSNSCSAIEAYCMTLGQSHHSQLHLLYSPSTGLLE